MKQFSKKLLVSLIPALFLMTTFGVEAKAGRADAFEGIYEILERRDLAAKTNPLFLLDADTLGNIWTKYANGKLPADLEKYRNEPSIIAGFSDRETLFLTFEKNAFIANGYIALPGADGNKLELRRAAGGQSDMAVEEAGKVTIYKLGPPQPLQN